MSLASPPGRPPEPDPERRDHLADYRWALVEEYHGYIKSDNHTQAEHVAGELRRVGVPDGHDPETFERVE